MRTVVKVENLSKKFLINHEKKERYDTIRDTIELKLKEFFTLKTPKVQEEYWALNGLNFEIKQGDKIGIMGRNGAGKSTLLKILSRITEQTSGKVKIKGRVSSLLEVGTGFHPELTGRENIFLNGAILGMTRLEIKRKFEDIVNFSGIEKFLDTPVKKYSSGMYVRLAFAVAVHLEPEILIIDEVLAVGDMEFQKKCLSKMQEVAKEGRTVLFVSHNVAAIKNLCNRGFVLENGFLAVDSTVEEAINYYLEEDKCIGNTYTNLVQLDKEFSFTSIFTADEDEAISRSSFEGDEDITLSISFHVNKEIKGGRIVLTIINEEGIVAFTSTNHRYLEYMWNKGLNKTKCIIPKHLLNKGQYSIQLFAGIPGIKRLIEPQIYLKIQIIDKFQGSLYQEKWPGIVAPKIEWA